MSMASFQDGEGLVIAELRHILQALDAEEALGNYTLAELRAYCKRFGLKSSGCKRDIIHAVAEHVLKVGPPDPVAPCVTPIGQEGTIFASVGDASAKHTTSDISQSDSGSQRDCSARDEVESQLVKRKRSGLKIETDTCLVAVPLEDHQVPNSLEVKSGATSTRSARYTSKNSLPTRVMSCASPLRMAQRRQYANTTSARSADQKAGTSQLHSAINCNRRSEATYDFIHQDENVANAREPSQAASRVSSSTYDKDALTTHSATSASPSRINERKQLSCDLAGERSDQACIVGSESDAFVPNECAAVENIVARGLKRKSSSSKMRGERHAQVRSDVIAPNLNHISNEDKISIEVRLAFSGLQVATLQVLSAETVCSLKGVLSSLRTWPPGAQQLVFEGRVLEDSATLVDCGVHDGSIISVLCESLRWHDKVKGSHAELNADRLTVSRRDCNRKFNSALVVANGPARCFSFQVIDNSARFAGGVEMGFSCVPPHALADDLPQSAMCLRHAFICDCHGEFHALKGAFHALDIDFEEQGWDPAGLRQNDLVSCSATDTGRMQVTLNGHMVADWDAGIPAGEQLYPVVSIFGKAVAITLVEHVDGVV